MSTSGKAVAISSGKRGILVGGKVAVFDAEGKCAACCIEFTQQWSFTDSGFIDGGQDGAFRAYDHPADVPASPWSILNNGLGLRLDWEDDWNCRFHNPYTQYATAACRITVPRAMIMTVSWSGMGERQAPWYDIMSLYVDGGLVGSAHAPGGFLGCAGGHGSGPLRSAPAPAGAAEPRAAPAAHRRHDQRSPVPLRGVVSVRPELCARAVSGRSEGKHACLPQRMWRGQGGADNG